MKTIQKKMWMSLCCASFVVSVSIDTQASEIGSTVQGGAFLPGQQDEFANQQILDHQNRYTVDRDNLINQGLLPSNPTGFQPRFILPLRSTSTDPSFYGISNLVDHNPDFNGNIQDYDGYSRTYDSIDSNHRGTDYFTWPYGWEKMDRDEVEVIAAADGVITTKLDGNFDRNCDFSNPNWNAVYITYNDGSYSYYGHLKNGSLTTKPQGASVFAGEYLGVVGSSGSSTGPHLHFETYNILGELVDPFYGPGNRMNDDTWWLDQEDYREPQVNKLATHDMDLSFPSCPGTVDTTNYQDDFKSGDTVYLAAYYRDQNLGGLSTYKVFRPDGSLFDSWDHNSPDDYDASYWYWSKVLPNNVETGAWKFTVDYNLKHYEHTFYVGDLIFESSFED